VLAIQGDAVPGSGNQVTSGDWRHNLIEYINDTNKVRDRKV
jgi:hypothetical protein